MEYRRITHSLGLCVLMLLLTSCQMWPQSHMKRYFKYMAPEVRLARLSHFNNWRVEGVFSVQCVGTPHYRALTVTRFSWKNIDKRQFTLRLESNENDYDATVIAAYKDFMIWRDFKYPVHIATPETYMQAELGWSIPIRSMAFWLRGIPAPAPFNAHYNQYGLIDVLNQQGWTICYQSFTDMDGYSVPRSMTMTSQGVTIKIVLNKWDTLLLNRSLPPL